MKKTVFSLIAVICFLFSVSAALAADEWTEADFMFYDSDMNVLMKPSGGGYGADAIIKLNGETAGQTYRGIKVGSYVEELLLKYDLSDADWLILNTGKSGGPSDRSEVLTEKLQEEGKTAVDIVAMNDFLCAKDYYYIISFDIYRDNGRFVTKSRLSSDLTEEEMREELINDELRNPDNTYTREELEVIHDELYADYGDGYLDYYNTERKGKKLRTHCEFRVEKGMITTIELVDHYYFGLSHLYDDYGNVNELYSYILDLK